MCRLTYIVMWMNFEYILCAFLFMFLFRNPQKVDTKERLYFSRSRKVDKKLTT